MYLSDQEVYSLKNYIGNNLTVNQGMYLMQFFLMKEEEAAEQKEIADAKAKADAEAALQKEKEDAKPEADVEKQEEKEPESQEDSLVNVND